MRACVRRLYGAWCTRLRKVMLGVKLFAAPSCARGAASEKTLSKRLALPIAALTLAVALAAIAFPAGALFDPSKEYVESPPVAARYNDPDIDIPTPAFRLGKTDFTSQDELPGFIDDLDRRAPDARVRSAGQSQESHPLEDRFYGDRHGTIVDPFGHIWTIATHVEDVAPEELQRRMKAMMSGS